MSSLTQKFNWIQDTRTRPLIRRLLTEYARPHKKAFALGIFFMILVALTTALLAKQMQPIIDDVFFSHDTSKLYTVSLQIFLLFLLKGGSSYGESVIMGSVSQKMIADIEGALFQKVIGCDLAYLQKTHSGALISRFLSDIPMLQNAVTGTLTSIVKDVLTVAFLVMVMVYQDWMLSCCAMIIFPLVIWPVSRIGKRMRKTSMDILKGWGTLSTVVTQAIQSVRLIKAYGLEVHESQRAQKIIEKNLALAKKGLRIKSGVHPLMELFGGLAIIVVILYGGTRVIEGVESAGAFFSFITAFIMAYEPLKSLAKLNSTLQESLGALSRVLEILDVEPQVVESPSSVTLKVSQGKIHFQEVSFEYTPGIKVLDGITLTLNPGEKVALVGPSGAGKSTLLNLIPRFYDPTQGAIFIDDQDIAQGTLSSLRRAMALVSQDVTLFDATVYENIVLGDLEASPKAVEEAARHAAAHEFIVTLEKGYHTPVGERGLKLSGGQRQRLALAQAMVRKAPILLLDEATSSLDSESEKRIQEALKRLLQGRTSLTIAHRLSTVMDADMIYVMDQGRIVAKGKHQELLECCDLYKTLCKAQFSLSIQETPREEKNARGRVS